MDRRKTGFTDMSEFFAMGGYGYYVWGAYAASALLLTAEIVAVRMRSKRARTAEQDPR
jgi:heme exporter protein D